MTRIISDKSFGASGQPSISDDLIICGVKRCFAQECWLSNRVLGVVRINLAKDFKRCKGLMWPQMAECGFLAAGSFFERVIFLENSKNMYKFEKGEA